MKNYKFRFWLGNFLKSAVTLAGCNLVSYLFYTMFLNGTNTYYPEGASTPTVIFSVIMFVLSVIVFWKVSTIGSTNPEKIDERTLLENTFREAGYVIDYNKWFKDQLKTRLWGWYIPLFIGQIPLFVNYAILARVKESFGSVFEMPIVIYKWNMTSIFGYELLGSLWFLGPIIYLGLFISLFTYLVYREQKKWLVKPSYVE